MIKGDPICGMLLLFAIRSKQFVYLEAPILAILGETVYRSLEYLGYSERNRSSAKSSRRNLECTVTIPPASSSSKCCSQSTIDRR